jgi:hypothetical protein
MATNGADTSFDWSRASTLPVAILAASVAMSGVAWLSAAAFGTPLWPLAIAGALAGGIAVAMRPNHWAFWLIASGAGTLSYLALPQDLDTIRLMILVLSGVAVVGAILAILPQLLRRIAISFLILFHFVGIATAITSVPPQPWLSSVLWTYVYRPYLEFIYFQNAYHFYSPEPGPACMMWFYVKYEDGTSQWVKIPRREDFPLALEYQRRLSMTESINQLLPTVRVPQDVEDRRLLAGSEQGIPVHPGWADIVQYRVPTAYSKRMLETYTRFICGHTPHPTNEDIKVKSVKVYRVLHNIVEPTQVKRRIDAQDPTNYYPFYQGEYTPDGKLKDSNDPFLYWLIPILKRAQPKAGVTAVSAQNQELEVVDYCTAHAELSSWSN